MNGYDMSRSDSYRHNARSLTRAFRVNLETSIEQCGPLFVSMVILFWILVAFQLSCGCNIFNGIHRVVSYLVRVFTAPWWVPYRKRAEDQPERRSHRRRPRRQRR